MTELDKLKQELERERLARNRAEKLVEATSAALNASNLELKELNKKLEIELEARAEESLILARFPEEIPDPVMRISRYGIITYTNTAYKEIWKPFLNLQEGDQYPAVFQDDIFKAIIDHSSHVAEFTLDNRCWSVQFNAVEQYGYVNIMARDISVQKKAEEKIRKSQEALLEAQELGNLGRWEFNMEEATFIWSPQLFRQYGFEPAEEAPQGGDFFLYIHPEDTLEAQNGIRKSIADGYSIFEHRIIHQNGSIRNLYTTVKTEYDQQGEPLRIYGTSMDVTELRNTEQQLRESEARFQLALQGMNDGLWDWNMENNTVYISPQWKSLLGYQDDELDNNYETFCRFLDPDDLKRLLNLINNVPADPNFKLSYQFRIQHRDGSWRHMMARSIVLHNSDGKKIRMVGANTDITDRIHTEQKLLNSLEQMKILSKISFMFNSVAEDFEEPIQEAIEIIGKHSGVSRVYVFENSSDGVFASNTFEWCQKGVTPMIESLQNIPYSALQAFQKALLKKKGIIASNISSMSPAIQRLLNKQGVKSLMIMPFYVQDELTGFVGFDDCVQTRQWESADVELLRTFTNLIGSIFERQQAEYKVLQSEEKYRSLVNNLTEVIFQTNQQSNLTFLNPTWQEITGFTPEESLGKPLLSYIIEEDLQEFHSLQQLLFERKTDFCRQVMRIRSKDGSIRHVEILARLIEGKWGQAEGLNGTLTDFTEQHNAKEKLIKAKEIAEKASQAKAQFLSVMSHEIRTPLNAILGISHLLIRQQPRPDQEENLRMLKFSGQTLLSLINDILDFNKIESGKITIEKTSFNLRKLCNSLQKSLSLKADEKGVALQLVIDEATPAMVVGDPTRLTQILNNLLDNAIKFTHRGFVRLSVKALLLENQAVQLEFTVTDTGIGVPKDSLEKMFEAFTQVHLNGNHPYGGTGLGLAIIKRLLELQGSKVEVSSTPGKGSRFSFKLSFGAVEEQPPLLLSNETEFTPAQHHLQKASLLLVEDNPLNMLVLVQFLEIWGIQPDIAENGVQALSKIREKIYDLVLMDLHMPEMNGFDTTRCIREELELSDLPIIALTANALPGIRQKVLAAGMNDYLSKPFEPEELYQKVVHYLPQPKTEALTTVQLSGKELLTVIESTEEKLYSLHKLYQQSNNNAAFVERMVRLFIKTCQEQLQALRENLELGEAATVRDIAHRLKPSIDLFGIRCQTQAVRRLELMELSEMQTPEGWQVAENLIKSLYKVIQQLEDWLREKAALPAE